MGQHGRAHRVVDGAVMPPNFEGNEARNMETITVSVVSEEGLRAMQELERKRLIIMQRPVQRDSKADLQKRADAIRSLKGALPTQPIEEVDAQLNELRNAWE